MSEVNYILGIDHIGIAVPDLFVAMKQYKELGFLGGENEIFEEEQYGVRGVFMRQHGYCIELLEPLDKNMESPIDSYINTKPYKMYHIAYNVSDFDKQIEIMKAQKYVMIDRPKSSKHHSGKRTVFLFNRKLGIVELMEK